MSKAPLPTFDDEKLSAADKVTALLLTMSKPSADSIIKKFDNREIRLVAHAATALPSVPGAGVDVTLSSDPAAVDAVAAASSVVASSSSPPHAAAVSVTAATAAARRIHRERAG